MHCKWIIGIVALVSLRSAAQEPDSSKYKWLLSGYIKNMPSVRLTRGTDRTGFLNLLHNRLNVKLEMPADLSVNAGIRNRLFMGNQVAAIPDFAGILDRDNGLLDLSFVSRNSSRTVWNTTIDRLHLNWSKKKWDITMGRQRINWGMHNVFNPNDIFNTFNFLDFDYEERPGTDAIRIQFHPAAMKTLELAWKTGKQGRDQVGALLFKFNTQGYDWQILSGRTDDDWVMGAGWAGNIGELGFKGELSYFHPRHHFFDTIGTISLSAGWDATCEKGWYLGISYLLNSSGHNQLPLEGAGWTWNPTAKELLPFRHTAYIAAARTLNPIFNINLGLLYAPGGSNYLILLPGAQYWLADDWELSFFSQHFMTTRYSLDHIFYTRVRWSF